MVLTRSQYENMSKEELIQELSDIENLLETDNLEKYINNASF